MEHLRIVTIRNVDMCRDGGTIGIKCHGYLELQGKAQEFELCFDRRGRRSDGGLWIGYPEKTGSVEVVDATIKAYVVERLSEFKRNQQARIDTVLSGLSPEEQ